MIFKISLCALFLMYSYASCVRAQTMDDIKRLKADISSIKKKTEDIKIKTKELTDECNRYVYNLTEEYGFLVKQHQHKPAPLIKAEHELAEASKKSDVLDTYIQDFNKNKLLLKLKKDTLSKDVEVAEKRKAKEYNLCKNFSSTIGYHYEKKVSARAYTDYSTNKLYLTIEKNQVLYLNVEAQKYLEFFNGWCQRKISLYKTDIEILKQNPASQQITETLHRKELVDRKIQQQRVILNTTQGELQALAQQIDVYQKRYDSLKTEINCFVALDQWNIQPMMDQIFNTVQRLNSDEFLQNGEDVHDDNLPSFSSGTAQDVPGNKTLIHHAGNETDDVNIHKTTKKADAAKDVDEKGMNMKMKMTPNYYQ